MLSKNHLSLEVINAHNIDRNDIDSKNWNKISQQVKSNIDYTSILSKGCSQDELVKARSIGTGLSWFKDWKIEVLIKHAEAITELQIKLFLPHLLK